MRSATDTAGWGSAPFLSRARAWSERRLPEVERLERSEPGPPVASLEGLRRDEPRPADRPDDDG